MFFLGSANSFTVTATGGPHPAISASGSPSFSYLNLSFTDNHDGTATLSGTPVGIYAFPGASYQFNLTAANGFNPNATQSFTLAIDLPLSAVPTGQPTSTLFMGTPARFQPVLGTGGFGAYTYTVSPALPTGLSIGSGTGIVFGTPRVATSSSVYTVTVTDGVGGTATATFTMSVSVPTFVVNTTTDDATGTASNCPPSGSATLCTLRDAITATNAAGAGNITFPSLSGTIILTSTLPVISSNTVITGPGAGTLTISGSNQYGIFSVASGTVSIAGLTITGGNRGGSGEGIYNYGGTVTVQNCLFAANAAPSGGSGGAIYNQTGTMVVADSTFQGNSAPSGMGGAVFTRAPSPSQRTRSSTTPLKAAELQSRRRAAQRRSPPAPSMTTRLRVAVSPSSTRQH